MRLGLVYLPEPDVSAACVAYARALVRERTPRMVVGPGALPHLTIVHVESADAGRADGADGAGGEGGEGGPEPIARALLERALAAGVPPTCTFDVQALGLLRYDAPYNVPLEGASPGPATMAWLMVPCSAALRSAERAAVAAVHPRPITTGNGDAFQPHMTIAMWEGHAGAPFEPPLELLPRAGVAGTLAVGLVGPNGTYVRTLAAAEPSGASAPGA